MKRLLFLVLIGGGGLATLIWLGIWQLQRLEWKEGVLTQIENRLAAAPVDLPDLSELSEEFDEYRPYRVDGAPTGDEIHVFTSGTAAGVGYRVIAAFEMEGGRRIMVDRGLLPGTDRDLPPLTEETRITGTLLWPDDKTSATPAPNLAENEWFARDVPAMAEALGTDALLLVEIGSSAPDTRLTQLPVDTSGIANDHLEYAITWFSMALVWAGMTLYFVARSRPNARPKD